MIIKFDDRNVNWSKDEKYNYYFIKNAENLLNDILKFRGYVMVMEVYKELGVDIDIDYWLERPLNDAMWFFEERGLIDFKPVFKEDGTILLNLNID